MAGALYITILLALMLIGLLSITIWSMTRFTAIKFDEDASSHDKKNIIWGMLIGQILLCAIGFMICGYILFRGKDVSYKIPLLIIIFNLLMSIVFASVIYFYFGDLKVTDVADSAYHDFRLFLLFSIMAYMLMMFLVISVWYFTTKETEVEFLARIDKRRQAEAEVRRTQEDLDRAKKEEIAVRDRIAQQEARARRAQEQLNQTRLNPSLDTTFDTSRNNLEMGGLRLRPTANAGLANAGLNNTGINNTGFGLGDRLAPRPIARPTVNQRFGLPLDMSTP